MEQPYTMCGSLCGKLVWGISEDQELSFGHKSEMTIGQSGGYVK